VRAIENPIPKRKKNTTHDNLLDKAPNTASRVDTNHFSYTVQAGRNHPEALDLRCLRQNGESAFLNKPDKTKDPFWKIARKKLTHSMLCAVALSFETPLADYSEHPMFLAHLRDLAEQGEQTERKLLTMKTPSESYPRGFAQKALSV